MHAPGARLETLRLNPASAQKVIGMVVLKQFSWGVMSSLIPQAQIETLRGCIRQATGTYQRLHSWQLTSALVSIPAQLDPAAACIYTHLTSVLLALRTGVDIWDWWIRATQWTQPTRPQGPRAFTVHFLQKLRLKESEDLKSWIGEREVIHILSEPWTLVKHKLRDALRRWLLRHASVHRKNARSAELTMIHPTVKLVRMPDTTHRAELCAIITDGVWTNHRKYRANLIQDLACEGCPERDEDIAHVIHECPKWAHLGHHLSTHHGWLQRQEPAVRCCLLCPAHASPMLRAHWPWIQREAAEIVHARQLQVASREGTQHRSSVTMESHVNDMWAQPLPRFEDAVPMSFTLAPPHLKGPHPWPMSVQQWNRLTWFFSKVRLLPEGLEAVRCSLLELHVSMCL